MKMKRGIIVISLLVVIFIAVIFIYAQENEVSEITETRETPEAGITPDNFLYFVDPVIDNIKLGFASEENKANVAAEIHDERIAEAQVVAGKGSYDSIEKALDDAEEKIKIIQEEITPEAHKKVTTSAKTSVEVLTDVKEKVPEEARDAIENAINNQIVQEKKTEIVAEITSKINGLCKELIGLVGLEEAIKQEPRCNPDIENSPKWLKRKATGDGEYVKFDEEAKKKFIDEMSVCFNDPRECKCEEIPIKSFSNTCFKIIPNVINCQFEQDENACKNVEEISGGSEGMFSELPEEFRGDLESFFREKQNEAFKKNAPSECVEAGAKDFDSCSKIMFAKFAPPECVSAGVTTREECMKIMSEKYGGGFGGAPSECMKDGKFIDMEDCRKIMMKKFLPTKCAEANAFTPESCQKIMESKFSGGQFPEGFQGPPGGFPPGFQPPAGFGPPSGFEGIPNVQENFNQVDEQLENVPAECEGLTTDECEAKTGKSFGGPELPGNFVFKNGEAVPVTQDDINSISQKAGKHVGEVDVNAVREQVGGDIVALESGISTLEQAPTESVAGAVSESASEAPTESAPEATTTGSAILDFMNKL